MIPQDDINRAPDPFFVLLKRGALDDLATAQESKRRRTLRKMKWTNPKLGTLGVLPDEVLVEICKHLVPAEVEELMRDTQPGKFNGRRHNILSFMRASSKLYGMARELECFNRRTFHFAISGHGFSFEGHRDCPWRVSQAAMKYMTRMRILVEIDLGRLIEPSYFKSFGEAYEAVWGYMEHLTKSGPAKRLDRYDIDVYITDSKYVPGKPSPRPRFLEERDVISMDGYLRSMLTAFADLQNIRVGNVRLLSQPLTYHPMWNCTRSHSTHAKALAAQVKWRRAQRMVDAAAYLLSGWDEAELNWCARFLRMPFFDNYYTRFNGMSRLKAQGLGRPPVYDNVVRNRCRCGTSCFHI